MHPARAARIALAVSIAVGAVTLAAAAAQQDAPKRKSGLWQQSVTTSGVPIPPQAMSMCTDEKTDDLIAARAGESQNCERQSVRREGDAYVVDAVCRSGTTTIRTQGRFSGDFSSRYTGELRSTFEPPMNGMKQMTQRIDARWVGPCKPGQKPGDVMLEGGAGMNMNEMMQADPRKMQEMMQRMQQMQQQHKSAPR